jgi:release factor glutamine methyltransferase
VSTRDHAYRMLAWRLRQAGVPNAELDARLLVQAATGADDIEMIREPGKPVGEEEEALLAKYEKRRLGREPVSKILGLREFWGLSFAVTKATLDPRPDSETLVEAALKYLRGIERPRLLDLGTGSGCLLLALLASRKDAQGLGVDVSPDAISVARNNAERLGIGMRASFEVSDWTDMDPASFDLVISNPPYIASAEIEGLEDEVRLFDPRLALDGGEDGFDAYRSLAHLLPRFMTPQAHAVIELGTGQAAEACAMFSGHSLEIVEIANDLAGMSRALVLRVPRVTKDLAHA